jgi:hypothetical protein
VIDYAMIETLISSKTRIKLLQKFFLNSDTTAYLRSLEGEFGDSTNAIRLELNHLEKAGLLQSFAEGNKKIFKANRQYPLFDEIRSILLKNIGIDQIITMVVERLGSLQKVYLTGKFAAGLDCDTIELIFYGEIDEVYLKNLVKKAERLIGRKISYVVFRAEPIQYDAAHAKKLLLWTK